ncbi:MAG: DUF4342 domain-containing protein [Candidatus Aminicenantales bacterium]|jgi:hypothetical protein
MADEKKGGKTHSEEFKISGNEILGKIKELIHEGNIRRIILKDESGKTFLEIPLTVGLVGVALAPILAAIGAAAALVTKMTIVVEKVDETK